MVPDPDFQLFSSLRYDPLLLSVAINTEHWDGNLNPPNPFYMLPFHRDRILQATKRFGWAEAASKIQGPSGLSNLLKRLEEKIDIQSPTPLRVRILLDHNGNIAIEPTPVAPVSEFNLFPHRIPPPPARSEKKLEVSPLTGGALMLGDGDFVYGDPLVGDIYDVIPDKTRIPPSPYTTYKTTSRGMYEDARQRIDIKAGENKEVLIVSDKDGEIMEGSLTTVYFWRDGKWTTPPVASGGQAGTTRRWALEKGFCVEGVVKADDLVDGEECWISNGVRGFNLGKVKLT